MSLVSLIGRFNNVYVEWAGMEGASTLCLGGGSSPLRCSAGHVVQ